MKKWSGVDNVEYLPLQNIRKCTTLDKNVIFATPTVSSDLRKKPNVKKGSDVCS